MSHGVLFDEAWGMMDREPPVLGAGGAGGAGARGNVADVADEARGGANTRLARDASSESETYASSSASESASEDEDLATHRRPSSHSYSSSSRARRHTYRPRHRGGSTVAARSGRSSASDDADALSATLHSAEDAQLAMLIRELTAELKRNRQASEQKCTSNLLAIVVVSTIIVICLVFSIQAYRRLKASTDYLAWCCEHRMQSAPLFRP